MDFAGMTLWSVPAAAVAAYAFGSVYYMLLAKPWMAALGKTEADIKPDGKMDPTPFIVAFVSQLVMAFVLAGLIGHLGAGQVTPWNGLISGFFVWIGFVATTIATNHGFQGARFSLTLIDAGHWLGVLLIQGLVIGLIGV